MRARSRSAPSASRGRLALLAANARLEETQLTVFHKLQKTVGGASASALAALALALAAPLTVGAAHAETAGDNPSTGQNSNPASVTFGKADGTVGNDKVHIMALPDSDAIILESNGHFGIVDSGEDDDYADGSDPRYPWRAGIATWGGYTRDVDSYLQKIGVNSSNLDFYIGTHAHSDHIGNADTIIYKYRPKRIYTPQYSDSYITDKSRLWDNQKVYDDMMRAAAWAGSAYGAVLDQHVTPGYDDTIQMGDMRIQIIPTDPNENYKRTGVYDANLIAYTAKVTAHGRSAYLSADLETTNGQEDYVAPIVGHVDWLKSPHHGLPSSSNNGFVERLSPKLIMQTGYEFQTHDGAVAGVTRGSYEWFEAASMRKAGYDALVGTFTPQGITRPYYNVSMGHVFGGAAPERTWWIHDGRPWATRGWWEGHYGGWHYFDGKPYAAQNQWVYSGGSWYWMGGDSYMTANTWVNDGKGWYWVSGDGTMLGAGWHRINGDWYLMAGSGRAYTGWVQTPAGSWYYLDPVSAKMRTGWINDGSGWFYLGESGAMRTGWLRDAGAWYLLSGSGRAASGWALDGGSWYYLDPATNAMRVGWVSDAGKWYYLGADGVMRTGWVRDADNWYLLAGPGGSMLTGTVTYGGLQWAFGGDGALIS